MSSRVACIAGESAIRMIREGGLSSDCVRVVAGAAGGPKWLILAGLDRLLMRHFFRGRKEPLFMIGSSIGSWRFAALGQNDPEKAIENFEDAYIAQSYTRSPGSEEVSAVSRRILDGYLPDGSVREVMTHPFIRLGILAVRSKSMFIYDSPVLLSAAMAMAGLCNIVTRRGMGLFFERGLFYDSRDMPPYFSLDGFPMHRVPLDEKNLKESILASGSIPLVMSGRRDIPGAPPGVYRDGGMIDYHPSFNLDTDPDRIVLFPHYTDAVIPGWLDKHLPWRRASSVMMRNVCIVCPSRDFISRLPFSKIPDRHDFARFRGRDSVRHDYWRRALAGGKEFAEEFFEAVESGKIRKMVTLYGAK